MIKVSIVTVLLASVIAGCNCRNSNSYTARDQINQVGPVEREYPHKLGIGQQYRPHHLTWSPCGTMLALGSGNTVYVYDIVNDRILWSKKTKVALCDNGLAFTRLNSLLAVNRNGTMSCWDIDSGKEKWDVSSLARTALLQVCASRILVVRKSGYVEAIEPSTGKCDKITETGSTNLHSRFALTSDGELLANYFAMEPESSGSGICFHRTTDLKVVHRLKNSTSLQTVFRPCETVVALSDIDGVRLWDYKNSKRLFYLPRKSPAAGSINRLHLPLRFSSDGKKLVVALYPKGLATVDVTSRQVRHSWKDIKITAIAVSKDSLLVAIADSNNNVWIDRMVEYDDQWGGECKGVGCDNSSVTGTSTDTRIMASRKSLSCNRRQHFP